MRKLRTEELERKSVDEFKQARKTPVIIVLDNIRSLHNVGSVFRTADAFLIESIYLCGITGTPPHREIQKTALGATETVDWKYFTTTEEAVHELKTKGYEIYAIEQAEKSIYLSDFNIKNKIRLGLIFGNEVKGVEDKIVRMADGCIEIPQSGTKHSLNISVSVGIVVWDIYQKLKTVIK